MPRTVKIVDSYEVREEDGVICLDADCHAPGARNPENPRLAYYTLRLTQEQAREIVQGFERVGVE